MSAETVLLVDDEPEILDALRRTLRTEGYRLVTATSPSEARELLVNHSVDLVLSDMRMPGSSGLDLMTELRRTQPHVARVLLTGVATFESAVSAINDGAVHRFVTKPWDDVGLRESLRDALLRARDAQPSAPWVSLSPPLAPRLDETLRALMTGASEKQIADDLGVSKHTLHQYVKTLYRRFSVSSRPELMAKVMGRPA